MTDNILLEIKDLHARVGEKEILKGINLLIRKGEIHAVMGPNGAGKSTLSAVLAGKPQFEVTAWVFDLTYITRMIKMIHYFLTIHNLSSKFLNLCQFQSCFTACET